MLGLMLLCFLLFGSVVSKIVRLSTPSIEPSIEQPRSSQGLDVFPFLEPNPIDGSQGSSQAFFRLVVQNTFTPCHFSSCGWLYQGQHGCCDLLTKIGLPDTKSGFTTFVLTSFGPSCLTLFGCGRWLTIWPFLLVFCLASKLLSRQHPLGNNRELGGS